jgi:multidrug efflux pump subunit AcrA (membrane-fusion protein)
MWCNSLILEGKVQKRVWISGTIISLILLLTVAGIVFLVKTDDETGARLQEPVRQVVVEVREIAPQAYTRWVEAYSTVMPFRRGTVSAQVTGPIAGLGPDTEPGITVQQGQELAKIEDTRYQLSLRKAEAALRKLQALLEIEQNENERRATTYRIAKQRLALARSEYERNVELLEKELIAKQTVERTETQMELFRSEFEKARSELQSRQARIQSIQADLAAARAEVDRIEEDLADTVIRAPFDGVIGERFIEIGDRVAVGQKLLTVLEISSVKVVARIPSEFIGRIQAGMRVNVAVRAYPETVFDGTVIHIHPEADPKNRTFALEIKVVNQGNAIILPGMFARVRIPVRAMDQALLVPRDALMEDDRGPYVYVVDESTQTAQRRDLVLDDLGPEEALVAEGLSPGESVVVRGQERLQEGTSVQWIPVQSASTPGDATVPPE